MGKAKLIMDMPYCCHECILRQTGQLIYIGDHKYLQTFFCRACPDEDLSVINIRNTRPIWCPLKMVPENTVEKNE